MAYTLKPFHALNITDDYMFGIIMRRARFAQPFLEALLGKPIQKLVYADVQKDLPAAYEAHGIRLDVYIQDEAGTVYDIEMQTTTQKALEKRARYYQSGLDRWQLEKGADYPELHDTIVIFILMDDYFGEGYAKYEPYTTITAESATPYQSGARTLFLNAAYTIPNADEAILSFLDYARAERSGTAPELSSAYLRALDSAVEQAKLSKAEEVAYMTWKVKMEDERRMGRDEGIDIGIDIGRAQGIDIGKAQGEQNVLNRLVEDGVISKAQALAQGWVAPPKL